MTSSESSTKNKKPDLPEEAQRIVDARHHDPFNFLGCHDVGGDIIIRAFMPRAEHIIVLESGQSLKRVEGTDLFEWRGPANDLPAHYRLQWTDASGETHTQYDTYTFPPQLTDFDLHLYGEGKHLKAYDFLGAHPKTVDGVDGVLFSVWAPSAERVSVICDRNQWDGRTSPMRVRGGSGIWELFMPGMESGELYKFEVRSRDGSLHTKIDPYARQSELRPGNASIVTARPKHEWRDGEWIAQRTQSDWLHEPMSIYEVHLGSWQHGENGRFLTYRELADRLVPYVLDMGFTHIELLPITEHPLDASWGYQTTGYFSPTSRFGDPDDFRYFIDYCHQNGIGVFLDWAPGHFPKDAHALARFDGSALYEHADPRRGEHREWGTLTFNYGRNEVRNFLLSSALFWLSEYHLDGLRVDAVASMLYLDYSREDGDWTPNIYGGNENLEAIDFLRELNQITHEHVPGSLTMAEESTSWPMVSRPVWLGGLGFSMKWNMGWMNDTLSYIEEDPIHRKYHHDMLTFSQIYAFTENFILPFSHDEVVHGKQSMRHKMPGDEWQQFANLRLLYAYMYTHPGKKLMFMGCEFGQGPEWNQAAALDWYVLEYPLHSGLQHLVKDLNNCYRHYNSLHFFDFEQAGFSWIDCHDSEQSVLSYLRKGQHGETFVVLLNFTPVPRPKYRIGVPSQGQYRILINSDQACYGGSSYLKTDTFTPEMIPWNGMQQSISIDLPPLAGIILTLLET